jgi:AbrB family looped-hinge helix DNA binding protein
LTKHAEGHTHTGKTDGKGGNMKVTDKGRVTIPRFVREKLGIGPSSEIDFVEENGRFYIVKKKDLRVF